MTKQYDFDNVTLLITHYNRSRSLELLLKSFQEIHCNFAEIVVSDDGSKQEHINYLQHLQNSFNFKLITTPENKGLGNNINKGQDAVTKKLTLYVQEDFTPTNIFPEKFQDALGLITKNPEVDIIRFYAYFEYPYLKNQVKGYWEIAFNIWKPGYKKFYVYSDHPHLRRSNFFTKFGRYVEGQKGDETEYKMMMSFLRNKGKAMFYQNYKELFIQKNSEAEPTTMKRDVWRESENPILKQVRNLYRHLKFNLNFILG